MVNIDDVLDGNFSDDENNQNETPSSTPTNFAHTVTEIHYISELKKILVGRNNNTIYQKFKIDNRIQDLYDFQVVNKNNQIVDLSGFNYQFIGSYIDARQNEHVLFYSDNYTVTSSNILTFKINTYTSQYVNYVKVPKQIDISIRKKADGINQVILRDVCLAYPTPVFEGEEPGPTVAGFGLSKNGYVMSLTGTVLSGDNSTISITDNVISYIGTEYSAGDGIGIDNGVISITASIPSAVSQLTNDTGYITAETLTDYALKSQIPTTVAELTDSSNYALTSQIPTGNAQLENTSNFISGLTTSSTDWLELYRTEGFVYRIFFKSSNLSSYALKTEIPIKVSQLTNDTGYITGYNAGSGITIENGTINCTVDGANYSAGSGISISDQNVISLTATIPTVPSNVGAFINDVGYLTAVPSDTATTGWVEQQGYLTGVDLSNYAQLSDIPSVPTSTSQLTNDSNFLSCISVYDSENDQILQASGLQFDYFFTPYIDNNRICFSFNGIDLTIDGEDQGYFTTLSFGGDFTNSEGDIGLNFSNIQQSMIDSGEFALTSDIPLSTSQLINDSDFITSSALTGISTDKLQIIYVDETIHDGSFVMQYIPDVDIVQQTITTYDSTLTLNKVSGFANDIPVGKVATFENWITPSGDLTSITFSGVQFIGDLPSSFTSGYTQAFTRRIIRPTEDYTIQQISYNYEFDANIPDTPLIFELVDDNDGDGGSLYLAASGNPDYNLFYYKVNDGDWQPYTTGYQIYVDNVGDTISFKGTTAGLANSSSKMYLIRSNKQGKFKVRGKLNALINWSSMGSNNIFNKLFHSNEVIVDASELILPSTGLTDACYRNLFYHCTALTAAPELKAVDIPRQAYSYMFNGCTALSTAPSLSSIYSFTGDEGCASMFGGCTSLTGIIIPDFTSIRSSTFNYMLENCTALRYIKVDFRDWGINDNFSNWVKGVTQSSDNIFECPYSLNKEFGDNRIPSSWTVTTY